MRDTVNIEKTLFDFNMSHDPGVVKKFITDMLVAANELLMVAEKRDGENLLKAAYRLRVTLIEGKKIMPDLKITSIEDFIPRVISDERMALLWPISKCSICKKIMIKGMRQKENPSVVSQQISRLEVVMETSYDEGHCVKCEKEGKVTFECFQCCENRPMNESEESRGYPADHLCKTCYTSMTASDWDTVLNRMEDAHRYD